MPFTSFKNTPVDPIVDISLTLRLVEPMPVDPIAPVAPDEPVFAVFTSTHVSSYH